jgi:hypothetical protein
LQVDPTKRLGANGFHEIKNHAFFRDFDWVKLESLEMVSPLRDIVKKYPKRLVDIKDDDVDNKNNDSEYTNIEGITYAPSQLNL